MLVTHCSSNVGLDYCNLTGDDMKWLTGEPTVDGQYLVILKVGSMRVIYRQTILRHINGRWLTMDWTTVVRWMPLPEIPEEVTQ